VSPDAIAIYDQCRGKLISYARDDHAFCGASGILAPKQAPEEVREECGMWFPVMRVLPSFSECSQRIVSFGACFEVITPNFHTSAPDGNVVS
jgi:hypothetical protein